jgi:hypothetical protein
MEKIISIYLLAQVTTVGGITAISLAAGVRYLKNHGKKAPPGFTRTGEIGIDPVSNKRIRVYFNEKTGARYYLEEG